MNDLSFARNVEQSLLSAAALDTPTSALNVCLFFFRQFLLKILKFDFLFLLLVLLWMLILGHTTPPSMIRSIVR